MDASRFFVDRPIFAAVLSILIFVAGLLAIPNLPVSEYPEVVPPSVMVRAIYPGADPTTISETVAAPLEEAVKPDVLIAYEAEGGPLPIEHGGPARVITPQLYAWKGAKWIKRIELLREDCLGFWERNGYSNTAHPWRNDRYSRGGY